jgi:hypothetical protein
MPRDEKRKDLIGYPALQHAALRGVVREALKQAAGPKGLPGEHHFYISFRTDAPGVGGPPELLSKYPEEMTIVLQHQFWDLSPGEKQFSVTLQFSGKPRSLSIPYAAITRFYDPSVQYLLQFPAEEPPPPKRLAPVPAAEGARKPAKEGAEKEGAEKIVSLDQFRKK